MEQGPKMTRRQVADFFLGGFAAYGAFWVLVESFGHFFPAIVPEGPIGYVILVAIAAIGGVWNAWPTHSVEFQIPGSDTRFEIRFDDIFEREGVIVIPVNEYFDGELGNHVSRKSLHGQLIECALGGIAESFVQLTEPDLASVNGTDVTRTSGRNVRYPIGTTACAVIREKRYLLAALTHTDIESLSAYATVQDLSTCLDGIWERARTYYNGETVNVPLIGSGLSRIGLPPGNLIEVIATSLLIHTKNRKVADKVTLVLPKRLVGEVDLNSFKRSWT